MNYFDSLEKETKQVPDENSWIWELLLIQNKEQNNSSDENKINKKIHCYAPGKYVTWTKAPSSQKAQQVEVSDSFLMQKVHLAI